MKSSVELLRQIIREQIETIMEYRPNAFMLSQMEEQDQDGDGDEDFDDVRMARFQKGGMTRDAALSKVSKRPLGKPGSKIKSSSSKK